MRGQGRLDSFGSILAGLAHRLGLESKLFEARLRRQWTDIVGEPIAAHTRPDQIRFKKLTMLVHNSVWLQQLTFLKPVLLQKVNAMAGERWLPKSSYALASLLRTVQPLRGRQPRNASAPTDRPTAREATLHTQGIQDEALRDQLTAVMVQTLSRPELPSPRPREAP